jgi:hypothetical protein
MAHWKLFIITFTTRSLLFTIYEDLSFASIPFSLPQGIYLLGRQGWMPLG